MMKFCVYMLRFERDGSRYIGHTDNLVRRIKQHLAGKCKYTKSKGPFKLIYVEVFESREEAVKREKFLKSRAGRRFLDKYYK